MRILVLNCGSSSVKFQLINMRQESILAKGMVEKIGSSDAIISYQPKDKNTIREIREVFNHQDAVNILIAMLLHPQHGVIQNQDEIDGIGHRVVHGGESFSESVLITEQVKSVIQQCIQFAPLHNPHNLKGIEACEKLLPGISQVAVFDTAFHQTIPPKAYIYGLPYALYQKLGIRRYGFHGTSHRYVAEKAAQLLNSSMESLKLITCHLGNGASITAVDGGKSVDTSMGFTPLEGLIMGTRCGDIDPALVPYIMERENLSTDQIDAIMNKNSGMLGLTATSNDMREIEAEALRGSPQHRLALDIYCHAVKKYIGAYMAELGRVNAIIFTGGIGEHSNYVRERSLENMESFGIQIDPNKNKKNSPVISTGKIKILVIPTDEELAIARDTKQVLASIEKGIETPISKAPVSEMVEGLDDHEKVELVLLWANHPKFSISQLTQKLCEKMGKHFQVQIVKRELDTLGLRKHSRTQNKQSKKDQ